MTVRDSDRRPSPDALLARANREKRGRLKIFLGAAPGVGKTYEMLVAAGRKRREGLDVVIGVVETHGRRETQALLTHLEELPRISINYRGHSLSEFDLDGMLARRPALALVDELAHTNAEGSRHPKRYQDIEELLAAGIDVYTTFNVQHLESLNDIVAQITQIRIRETVPDSFFDQAYDIEVVDITPDELMTRLREGKVYADEVAQRALTNYFKEGNLTALRELTLRRAAERVDGQMRDYMRLHGISGPWAAGDRIMVCLSERPVAAQLIRHAKRVADRLNAPWVAVYVETARSQQLSEAARTRVAAAMLSAEEQGAETVTLPGTPRLADALLAYAREANVTQIVIGKSRRPRWFEFLHGSVVRDLVDRAGNITVHVMAEDALPSPSEKEAMQRPVPSPVLGLPYLLAILPVVVATGIAVAIDHVAHLPNISLVYLGAVLAAVRFGPGPSLFAALLSAACYNFFLLPPTYTFTIADPANLLALLVFLFVAVFVSRLAARVRSQTRMARDQARTTAALLSVSRRLSGMRSSDELISAIATQIAALVRIQCVVLVPDPAPLTLKGAAPNPAKLTDADLAAARWSFEKNQVAGRGSDTLPGARLLFVPVRTGGGVFGVIGADTGEERVLGPDERRLLDALADLAAISLERIQLAKDVDQARLMAETEKMRAALLTSVSHDLRTPLASILAAITSLRSYGNLFDAAERDDTLATAQEETERLNRFVSNLLDLTRLDAGALVPKRETCDLHDLLGSAIKRLSGALANHRVEIDIPDSFPLLEVDFLLMEQVLVNLLDNASKYAPAGSVIAVRARAYRFSATVSIIDEGPGLPEAELDRVFERFHRGASDRQPAGTGLGLAICKGFINTMGSVIRASNRKDRSGAEFTIDIPGDRIVRLAVGAAPSTVAE